MLLIETFLMSDKILTGIYSRGFNFSICCMCQLLLVDNYFCPGHCNMPFKNLFSFSELGSEL